MKKVAYVDLIDQALIDQVGVLSPVTVTELLSAPNLSPTLRRTILELPTLPMTEGVWERAGLLRAKVLRTGRQANLANTLIVQNCLDHHATLVTRDRDFKTFVSVAGLRIALPCS